MPVLVDKLRISNFRSLANVELSLSRTTVLVGMNNSGKSSVLKALQLALGAERRIVGAEDFHSDGVSQQLDEPILIDLRIIPVDTEGHRTDLFDAVWTQTDFLEKSIVMDDDRNRQYVVVRTRIAFDEGRSDYVIKRTALASWPDAESWTSYTQEVERFPRTFNHLLAFFMDAQRDIVADLQSRGSYIGRLLSKVDIPEQTVQELEQRLRELNDEIVGNSSILKHLQAKLQELKQTVTSFGESVEITPITKSIRDLHKGLNVEFKDGAGPAFSLDYHGMGTRSWTALLTYQAYVTWLEKQAAADLGKPYHPLLLLEEPEAHLHPNAQRQLYKQLQGSLGQQVLSTHSPYVAAQAELEDLRFMRKQGAACRVKQFGTADLDVDQLRKVRREVMHTRGELLFARAIVLVEGETEEQAFPILARAWFKRDDFELGVLLIAVGGPNYVPFVRLAEAMDLPWLIFSDAEEQPKRELGRALSRLGLELTDERIVLLPDGQNIETYLVDQGFQDTLKEGFKQQLRAERLNPRHEAASISKIEGWTDDELRDEMQKNKTGVAAWWGRALAARPTEEWPEKLRVLMNKLGDKSGVQP